MKQEAWTSRMCASGLLSRKWSWLRRWWKHCWRWLHCMCHYAAQFAVWRPHWTSVTLNVKTVATASLRLFNTSVVTKKKKKLYPFSSSVNIWTGFYAFFAIGLVYLLGHLFNSVFFAAGCAKLRWNHWKIVNIETQMLFSNDTYTLDALINVTHKLLPCVWLISIQHRISFPRKFKFLVSCAHYFSLFT